MEYVLRDLVSGGQAWKFKIVGMRQFVTIVTFQGILHQSAPPRRGVGIVESWGIRPVGVPMRAFAIHVARVGIVPETAQILS
ncbi:hypothetical protein HS088_TW18G00491 [Tripterygium wilfordii]|uniref:Uncharacterized protein n=1 Tax=Tripterygium wilfordii TaxID=458696 RepID=A0A7J7CDJ3_TRIWF|nr:hypothetical protein HS088_TW18G00491 [Tripterygium wilfordii]